MNPGNRKKKISQSQRQKFSLNRIAFALSLAAIAGTAFFIYNNIGSSEDALANPGKDGAKTVSAANTIVNEYTTLTSNVSSGNSTINVSASSLNANGRFSASLASGDLVLIIQIQGASISTNNNSTYGTVSAYNNCGLYEFAKVSSVPNATSITLTTGLKNSYTSSGKVQVIRVPRYSNLTINSGASITCPAWDGSTGGIVAVESATNVAINGSINVDGKGFRGGTVEQNTTTPGSPTLYRSTLDVDGAEKGESIAGLASTLGNGRYGKGAPANGGGGGNAHNGGGGGGSNAGTGTYTGNGNPDNSVANWTTAWNIESAGFASTTSSGGGRGGYSWSSNNYNPLTTPPGHANWSGDNRQISGGLGGRPLDYSSTTRIFMGGGAGAGDSNNSTGTAGGNGGGIVFVLTKNNVTGTGSISAKGSTPPNTSSCGTCYGDAAGGGGGGGSVLIFNFSGTTSGISVNASGARGGNQNIITVSECESPGGGGGGGYVAITSLPAISINVTGGTQGSTDSPPMVNFTPNGATKGASGQTVSLLSSFNPYSASNNPLPVSMLSFTVSLSGRSALTEWNTAAEINNDYFKVERSWDGYVFEEIGRVKGNGTTSNPHHYSFADDDPFPGTSYYRVTQVDYNGDSEVFPIISFENTRVITEMKVLQVGPNPYHDELRIRVEFPSSNLLKAELLTVDGKKVWETVQQVESGSQVFVLNPQVKQNGVYLLRLTDAQGKSSVTKLVRN